MKSDEILAEIIGRNERYFCPTGRLVPDDKYPTIKELGQCPDEWNEKGCALCWLDWARKKAAESEEAKDPCYGCSSAFGCRDCRYEGSDSYKKRWDESEGECKTRQE